MDGLPSKETRTSCAKRRRWTPTFSHFSRRRIYAENAFAGLGGTQDWTADRRGAVPGRDADHRGGRPERLCVATLRAEDEVRQRAGAEERRDCAGGRRRGGQGDGGRILGCGRAGDALRPGL